MFLSRISYPILTTAENDLRIITDPVVIIPALSENPEGCITLEAVDDLVAEGNESFIVNVTADNSLDMVSGDTVVDIIDNDGK